MLSIVLARQNIREYDQIITLYTWENGRIEVLARGVKKLLSKNSAYLEPGSLIDAEIIPGKELSHLGSVEPVDLFPSIRKNIYQLTLLIWSMDFVKNLTHDGERDDRIFKMLLGWLKFLDSKLVIHQLVLIADVFAIHFFNILGFDIVYEKKEDYDLGDDLKLLASTQWNSINSLEIKDKQKLTIHNAIYRFALYHGEKSCQDWAALGGVVANKDNLKPLQI